MFVSISIIFSVRLLKWYNVFYKFGLIDNLVIGPGSGHWVGG